MVPILGRNGRRRSPKGGSDDIDDYYEDHYDGDDKIVSEIRFDSVTVDMFLREVRAPGFMKPVRQAS